MTEAKEPFWQKLFLAFLQTLVFGVLLAVFGYWLNLRLESNKQALIDQSERTKATLASQEPLVQQRRAAYLDFQQAARVAKDVLELYYYRGRNASLQETRSAELHRLANAMGVGSGGAGVSWVAHGDALMIIRKLTDLRTKYEDIASQQITMAADEYIDTLLKDVSEGLKKENDTQAFHESARRRSREAFAAFNEKLRQALGLEGLIIP